MRACEAQRRLASARAAGSRRAWLAAGAPVDDGAPAGAHGRAPQRLGLHAAPHEQRRLRRRRLHARLHFVSRALVTAPRTRHHRPRPAQPQARDARHRGAGTADVREAPRAEEGGENCGDSDTFAPKAVAVPQLCALRRAFERPALRPARGARSAGRRDGCRAALIRDAPAAAARAGGAAEPGHQPAA